jgi:hypothetical protein
MKYLGKGYRLHQPRQKNVPSSKNDCFDETARIENTHSDFEQSESIRIFVFSSSKMPQSSSSKPVFKPKSGHKALIKSACLKSHGYAQHITKECSVWL